jgi:hypothetical protein
MNSELRDFIGASFGSIWTLETLLVLMGAPERTWSTRELRDHLRSSDAVVIEATARLVEYGLARRNADGATIYEPNSADLDRLAKSLQTEFARAPAAVRRIIVRSRTPHPNAVAASFIADFD